MRYLTEICDKDGHSFPFLFVEIKDIGKYLFSAYDEETQKTVDVDTTSNCLGIATFKCNEIEYVVAAVHNETTAKLHEYVELISTQPISANSYVHDSSDICFETQRDRNVVLNMPTLTIKLEEFTRISEERGSVVIRMFGAVIRKPGEENRAYTLYDFLINLCRVCMLNVMSYETIRLVDTSTMMTIKLVHSSEADRFFNEMYERVSCNSFKRYVSDIHVDGKQVDYAIWPCASNLDVMTHDMDTGVPQKVIDFPIEDCYGFSSRQYTGYHVIVCHTARAAQLYKYIKLAKTFLTLEMSSDVDVCDWGNRANFKTPEDAATRTLAIDCAGMDILFGLYEPCGSVVCVENRDQTSVIYQSLFDFLSSVCTLTGLNIMAYRAVQFLTSLGDTEIIFDHGNEADIFFNKMYVLKKDSPSNVWYMI